MSDQEQDYGDFSEWLSRIDKEISKNPDAIPPMGNDDEEDMDVAQILNVIDYWVKKLQHAPTTTWKDELEVRGFEFPVYTDAPKQKVSDRLWQLIHCLAGLRVFLINTDHLSDFELYDKVVSDYMNRTILHIPFDETSGCLIDFASKDSDEGTQDWLKFYATNPDRIEWAKANPGKPLPVSELPAYSRDSILPKP